MKHTIIALAFVAMTANAWAQTWQTSSSTVLGTTVGDYVWQTGVSNTTTNYFYQNTWLIRTAAGNGWDRTAWEDGISVDASFQTPTTARTWWRRLAVNGVQSWGDGANTYMTLYGSNLGIGSANPDERLTVKGKVHAEEVKVDMNVPGPDYVFEKDYNLATLKEIESYIKKNKHLPEVPSAKEMEANGVLLLEMNMLLLKKIEELTLYVIDQQKQIDELNVKCKM